MLDAVDIGNPASEADHAYQHSPEAITRTMVYKVSAGTPITDDGWVQPVGAADMFSVTSVPEQEMLVALRYDADLGGTIRVFADDTYVGEWPLPPSDYIFGEDMFTIPGSFVESDSTILRFEFAAAPRGTVVTAYYWIYQAQSLAESLADVPAQHRFVRASGI